MLRLGHRRRLQVLGTHYAREHGSGILRKVMTMRSKTGRNNIGIGDEVIHGEYGLGKVLSKEGTSDDAKVLVKFREDELRELALKFARLKIVKRAPTG